MQAHTAESNSRKCKSCAVPFTFIQSHSEHGALSRVQPQHRANLHGHSACRRGPLYSLARARLRCQQWCRWSHQAKSVCWPAAGSSVVAYLHRPLGCGEYRMCSAKSGQRAHATSEERTMQCTRSAGRRAKSARPNPSFKRSANGIAHWPSSAGPAAHCALAVQHAMPLSPA